MNYFRHEKLLYQTEAMTKIIHHPKLGVKGYGHFMILMEILTDKITPEHVARKDATVRLNYLELHRSCRATQVKFNSILTLLQDEGILNFKIEKPFILINCPNLLKNCSQYTLKAVSRSEKCPDTALTHRDEMSETKYKIIKEKEKKERESESVRDLMFDENLSTHNVDEKSSKKSHCADEPFLAEAKTLLNCINTAQRQARRAEFPTVGKFLTPAISALSRLADEGYTPDQSTAICTHIIAHRATMVLQGKDGAQWFNPDNIFAEKLFNQARAALPANQVPLTAEEQNKRDRELKMQKQYYAETEAKKAAEEAHRASERRKPENVAKHIERMLPVGWRPREEHKTLMLERPDLFSDDVKQKYANFFDLKRNGREHA